MSISRTSILGAPQSGRYRGQPSRLDRHFPSLQARFLLRRIGKPGTGARKSGLDPASIAAELARLSPEPNSIPDSVEGLIGYILERYHQVHRRELPELRNLAVRVEQVHAEHPAVPASLSDLLARMHAALESHMQKEEQVLFPRFEA